MGTMTEHDRSGADRHALVRPEDPWSGHLSLLYAEHEIADRPSAAAHDGFRWVDSWWIDDDAVRTAFIDRLGPAQLRLACLNAYAGDLARGDRGFVNVPERREATIADILAAVDVVGSVGGRAVNVLVGRSRAGVSVERQLRDVRSVLRELAPHAAAARVTLVVEHLNSLDVPGYLLPTPADSARLVESVGHEHVRMLYDAFHAANMAIDAVADVAAYGGLIGHAQYADAPGRRPPGSGRGDPWGFAEALANIGYDAPIGLEFEPVGPTPEALEVLNRMRTDRNGGGVD